MKIVIAGAGEVGRHAAEVLSASGNSVTVIEQSVSVLRTLADALDVRTLRGNCAHADVLRDAGVAQCGLFVAATNVDELNLLSASLAKGVGAKVSVARVHHSAYFDNRGLDYQKHLQIDGLICPEYLTAVAIARILRHPGVLAIENFAQGKIEMQRLQVSADAPAVGVALADLKLPGGIRVAMVIRQDHAFIPDASTVIAEGDIVSVVGEQQNFEAASRFFQKNEFKRRHVVIVGGTAMGVWLCRALRSRHFSVRLFTSDRARAEELSAKLPHVTVIEADPTDPAVFDEEHIAKVDAFIALTQDDEHNILAAAQAKSLGAKKAIAVLQRPTYLHLLEHVGIDLAFSPRAVAAREIQRLLETGPVRVLATLANETADMYEIHVGKGAPVIGHPIREIKLPEPCILAGLQRGDEVRMPGAEDKLQAGDYLLAIGRHGTQRALQKLFTGK
ncbi:MAG: Trk system potassium transporter TrkA [Planctomycetes bacterium]|nr:Trk system potassium transporter TrkA [Planctomycetota bacterium]